MNCQKGDLAIVIRSPSGINAGKFVTCLHLATEEELLRARVRRSEGPVWHIDVLLHHTCGLYKPYAPDSALMPLRPNDGEGLIAIQEKELCK